MSDFGEEPPALAHIEKTIADAYRKEIEREENIWRSLPFFTATLAVEFTAIFQIADRLPALTGWTGWFSLVRLIWCGLFALIALWLLALSVHPDKFNYVATEVSLLDYTEQLIRDEQELARQGSGDPFSAIVVLKTSLARQYAEATVYNRQVNRVRERSRSIAGLAIICSVLSTLLLVATSLAHHVHQGSSRGDRHGPTQTSSARVGAGRDDGAAGAVGTPVPASPTPTDADRH